MRPTLTTEEAERGVRPPVMTKAQWSAMFTASLAAEASARRRTDDELHLRLRMYKAPHKPYWPMMHTTTDSSQLQARHAMAQEQDVDAPPRP